MSEDETKSNENSWSDRLKGHIKPEWMVERDNKRHPGEKDWRPGHLLWVMALGSPAEIDALFSRQTDMDVALNRPAKTKWQERESKQRADTSANENVGTWQR